MNCGDALLLFIAFALISSTRCDAGAAEPSQASPLYRQLRYDEDYSYLRSSRGNDLFDPMKFIPLNASGDVYLSFGGEARIRYEYSHNPQWGVEQLRPLRFP